MPRGLRIWAPARAWHTRQGWTSTGSPALPWSRPNDSPSYTTPSVGWAQHCLMSGLQNAPQRPSKWTPEPPTKTSSFLVMPMSMSISHGHSPQVDAASRRHHRMLGHGKPIAPPIIAVHRFPPRPIRSTESRGQDNTTRERQKRSHPRQYSTQKKREKNPAKRLGSSTSPAKPLLEHQLCLSSAAATAGPFAPFGNMTAFSRWAPLKTALPTTESTAWRLATRGRLPARGPHQSSLQTDPLRSLSAVIPSFQGPR